MWAIFDHPLTLARWGGAKMVENSTTGFMDAAIENVIMELTNILILIFLNYQNTEYNHAKIANHVFLMRSISMHF